MKGRKNAKAQSDNQADAAMDELLASDGVRDGFNFGDIEHADLGRFVAECCRHGLLVSCWSSTADANFVISIRAGERRRSYEYDTAQGLGAGIAALLTTLTRVSKP